MAFDPIQEDCLRLILEAMRRDRIPLDNPTYIQNSADAFRDDPASLIHADRDRSFHLVAKATEIIDYRVPFLSDEARIEQESQQAENYLREAVELDQNNWDAKRMLTALDAETNDAYVSYLLDNRDAVEHELAELAASANDPYSREFAGDLGQRPYLRWLAALASRSLIAGQYRLSLDTVEQSLAFAPQDPAGVRHTGMLALAKLEASPEDVKSFQDRHAVAYQTASPDYHRPHCAERKPDAWTLLSTMSLAYRSFDFTGAERALRTLLSIYPHAAQSLFYQAEFPDGLFCRVNVEPGSDDELVLAISEATPLLQEGFGTPENAGFSNWVAEHELVQSGLDEQVDRGRVRASAPRAGGDN